MSMPNNTKNILNPTLVRGFHARSPAVMHRLEATIEKHGGNLSAASRELRVSVESLRRWIKQEPKLAEAFRRARTKAVEESPLLQPDEGND